MKALIIEDEGPIATLLESMLRELRTDIDIVGVTTDISGSVAAISAHPDLDIIFSDIKIDDGLSFSVYDRVSTNAMVVFTTAYNEYALKAFDYNCVDYLIKPISKDALERALNKFEQRIPHADESVIRATADDIRHQSLSNRKRVLLQRGSDTIIYEVDQICFIQTEKGNTRVFLKDGLWGDIDISLIELLKSLSPELFCRISRQVVVNIDSIKKLTPGLGRDTIISMKGPYEKQSFQITQERKKELLKLLEN